VANTINLYEPDIDEVIVGYAGIQLERGPASGGPYSFIARIPYVANQTTYLYDDASGAPTDWYRSARYTPAGPTGPYSAPWAVSPSLTEGVTLLEIERNLARRVGPYYRYYVDRTVGTSTTTQVYIPALRSNVEMDLVQNLWLLRRGLTYQGTLVAVDPEDRQRTVSNYESQNGTVMVDRPWSTAPTAGEIVEFHHLDPDQELRPSVLAGLRRCYTEHTETLPAGYYYEIDLTDRFIWLGQDLRAVLRVEVAPFPTSGLGGGPWDIPFRAFGRSGHVWLRVGNSSNVPYNGGLAVTFKRPAHTLVNNQPSTYGPIADGDIMFVDLDYATAAAHIEAWHNFPAKLQAAAAGNLQMTRDQAALEFTRQARKNFPPQADLYQFQQRFPSGAGRTVVNA
jgi:hypothetical protein